MNFTKYLMGQMLLMDQVPPTGPAGGGGGGPTPPTPPAPAPDPKDKLIADLTARLDALEGKGKPPTNPPPSDDPDLAGKLKAQRDAEEKAKNDQAKLSSSIKFNLSGPEWSRTNASLLPKSVVGIFEAAEKENYGSETEKANAIKSSIIQEFFAIQENLDLLTETQKNSIAEFLGFVKNVKQEKAHDVYSAIFEPTLNAKRGLEKARQLSKGLANPTSDDDAHRQKMQQFSTSRLLKKGSQK